MRCAQTWPVNPMYPTADHQCHSEAQWVIRLTPYSIVHSCPIHLHKLMKGYLKPLGYAGTLSVTWIGK